MRNQKIIPYKIALRKIAPKTSPLWVRIRVRLGEIFWWTIFQGTIYHVYFLKWLGNFPSLIFLLKFSKINLTKISLLPLIISNRLRLCWLLNLRIFNLIQYFFKVTFWNEKTLLFIFSLNLRMLWWTLYFLIVVKTRSATSFVSTGNSFFLVIFKVFPLLTKLYWRY